MNTIIFNAPDTPEEIVLPCNLLDEFIFDIFKLIIVLFNDEGKRVGEMKFKITIKDNMYFDVDYCGCVRKFSLFTNVPDYKYYDFVNDKGEKICLCNTIEPSDLPLDYRNIDVYGHSTEYCFRMGMVMNIIKIMAYIVIEGRKRSVVIKKSLTSNSCNNKHALISCNKKVYLFDDIVRYVAENYIGPYRSHKITCPCWEVRGHYRHYKSGKVVFVPAYRKGKQKDKVAPIPHEYYAKAR